ncbi:RRM domain-containing protein [Aphelenchoides bicaudatus]|nr:RRM domain-containing protein [Aphelenchoides bicaudatus]
MQDSMQQQMPMGTMMNAPMPYQYASAGTSTDRQPQNLCPPDRTLWMGSIDNGGKNRFSRRVQKLVIFRNGTQNLLPMLLLHLAFKFTTSKWLLRKVQIDWLLTVLLNSSVKMTLVMQCSKLMVVLFRMTLVDAVSTCHLQTRQNHTMSSICSSTICLLQSTTWTSSRFLVRKYKSCRGAKVYRNYDGSSKKSGFVRFTSETDQQMALIEMNKVKLNGKELFLKLAHPRGGRTQHTSGRYSGSNKYAGNNNYSSGHSNRTYSSRGKHRSRSPRKSSPPPKKHFTESVDPPTVEEYNEFVYGVDWDFQMAMDSSRFSKYLIPVDTKTDDLAVKLYD